MTKWKREVQKYGYHENRNKKKIALTDEQQGGFPADLRYI